MTPVTQRPATREGTLIEAAAPRAPAELQSLALAPLTGHLETVCDWPQASGGTAWDIGDFAFYTLEFAAAPEAPLFVQVWSEPDEPLLVEVSSHVWNPATRHVMNPARRHALLKRGFELGGKAHNFRKSIDRTAVGGLPALASELLAILTDDLGYDGTAALDFKLHLGRRTQPAQVLDSLTYDDLGRLLHAWGITARPIPASNGTTYRCTLKDLVFMASLRGASQQQPGDFEMLALSMYVAGTPDVISRSELALRGELPFAQHFIDADGDLAVALPIYLGGGVTVEHLRKTLDLWFGTIQQVRDTVDKYVSQRDPRVLN